MDKPISQDVSASAKLAGRPASAWRRFKQFQFNQEKIVLAITAVLFGAFCLTLDQFATTGNLISLLQNVAILESWVLEWR